jgi:hypothetical protein
MWDRFPARASAGRVVARDADLATVLNDDLASAADRVWGPHVRLVAVVPGNHVAEPDSGAGLLAGLISVAEGCNAEGSDVAEHFRYDDSGQKTAASPAPALS